MSVSGHLRSLHTQRLQRPAMVSARRAVRVGVIPARKVVPAPPGAVRETGLVRMFSLHQQEGRRIDPTLGSAPHARGKHSERRRGLPPAQGSAQACGNTPARRPWIGERDRRRPGAPRLRRARSEPFLRRLTPRIRVPYSARRHSSLWPLGAYSVLQRWCGPPVPGGLGGPRAAVDRFPR